VSHAATTTVLNLVLLVMLLAVVIFGWRMCRTAFRGMRRDVAELRGVLRQSYGSMIPEAGRVVEEVACPACGGQRGETCTGPARRLLGPHRARLARYRHPGQ
jgi:hypothetical protein